MNSGGPRGSDSSDESSGNHLVVTGLYDVDGQERKSSISFDKIKQISLTYSLQSEDEDRQFLVNEDTLGPNAPDQSQSNYSAKNYQELQRQQQHNACKMQDIDRDQTQCFCCDFTANEREASLMSSTPYGKTSDTRSNEPSKISRQYRQADEYTSELDIDETAPDDEEEDEIATILTGDNNFHRQTYKSATSRKPYAIRDMNSATRLSNHGFQINTASSRGRQTIPERELAGVSRDDFDRPVYARTDEYYKPDEDYEDDHQRFANQAIMKSRVKDLESGYASCRMRRSLQQPWRAGSESLAHNDSRQRILANGPPSLISQPPFERLASKSNPVLYCANRPDAVSQVQKSSLRMPTIQDGFLQNDIENLVVYADVAESSYTRDKFLPPGSMSGETFRRIPNDLRRIEQNSTRGMMSATLTSAPTQGTGGLIRARRDMTTGSRSYNMSELTQPSSTARSDVAHLFGG